MLSVCLRGHVNTSSNVGAMRFWVRFWEAVSRMQWCQRISTEKRCNRNKAQDVCYATLCERLYRERWVSTTGSKVLEKTVRGRPDGGALDKKSTMQMRNADSMEFTQTSSPAAAAAGILWAKKLRENATWRQFPGPGMYSAEKIHKFCELWFIPVWWNPGLAVWLRCHGGVKKGGGLFELQLCYRP